MHKELVAVQPKVSARQACEMFLTVPQNRKIEREQEFLKQAINFYIPYKQIELSAFTWGKRPTVLLVHGWGANYSAWLIQTAGRQSNMLEIAEAI